MATTEQKVVYRVDFTRPPVTEEQFLQVLKGERTLDDPDAIILMPASFWIAYQQAHENYKERVDQIFDKMRADLSNLSNGSLHEPYPGRSE